MNNYIKMNTVIKILTVIIIGYFFFELLFGVITGNFGLYGGESSGSAHHAASNSENVNYSFNMLINALLVLLVKLLVVLFFILLIAGALRWIKSIWGEEGKLSKDVGISGEAGSVLIVTGATLGIILLLSIVSGFNYNGNLHNETYAVLLQSFLNILMYIIAVILGIELFAYFTNKLTK